MGGSNIMKYPILYKADETTFSHLGLGVLTDAISPLVTEEANGMYELVMQYPIHGEMYSEIKNDRIIKVDASSRSKNQRFRIIRVTTPAKGVVTVYAEHVSYQTQYSALEPHVDFEGNAQMALNQWSNNIIGDHPFTVYSDIAHESSGTWRIDKVENARKALGGVQGSILDTYGGEYFFDNYHIGLYANRGKDNGALIAYGKNLTDLEQEDEIASVYTSIYPYAKLETEGESSYEDDGELITLPEKIVHSEYADNFSHKKVKIVDFSSEDIKTESALRNRAKRYLDENDYGLPRVNLQVQFVDLSKTMEYEQVKLLEEINLFDTVTVYFSKLNIYRKAKVIKTVWNVTLERYELIEIGDRRSNLTSTINDELKEQKVNTEIAVDELRKRIADSYWNGDGYNYDLDDENEYGLPAGYYSFDRPIDQNPEKAIYMGAGTLLIANKKNPDGSWLWQTMATGDGLIADTIVAGTLRGENVKIDLDLGTFLIGKNEHDYAIYYDGDKLSMDFTTSAANVEVGDKSLEEVLEEFEIATGVKGDPGISNKLIVNNSYIKRNNSTNKLTPRSINIKGISSSGSGKQNPRGGHFTIYEQTATKDYTINYESNLIESNIDYTPTSNITGLRIEWYNDSSKTEILDIQTIPVIADGQDAIVGFLTNEAMTLPADDKGKILNYDGNTGIFKVFSGIDNVNSSASFKVKEQKNVTVTLSNNGSYTVTGIPANVKMSTAILTATYQGVTVEKELTISKSFSGQDGEDGYTPIKGKDYFDGQDGRGISTTKITYQQHTSGTATPTGNWLNSIPSPVKGRYLWTRTVITYTDSKDTTTTYSVSYHAKDGKEGSDGVGITSDLVEYKLSKSGTEAPSGTWSKTVPTPIKGQYLWTRHIINYTDGTKSETLSTAYHGKDGLKGDIGPSGKDGDDGRGIRNVAYSYQNHSNGTSTPSGGWSSTKPSSDPGRYLWTRAITTYTDGTTSTTYNTVYHALDGQSGEDGKGISKTVVDYQQHTSGSSTPTGNWLSSIPVPNKGRYLWTRTRIYYTDSTQSVGYSTSYYPNDGQRGPAGQPGVSVTLTKMRYYLSTAADRLTGGSWSDTAPKWDTDKYMWTKTVTIYSDLSVTETDPINVTGSKGMAGPAGLPGANGRNVNAVKEQYYLSTSKTTTTGGSWSDTSPIWRHGRYVWTRLHVTFTNPSGVSTTKPQVDASWEAMDNIRVGGRNLLRNSGDEITNNKYPTQTYDITETIEDGEQVTLSIRGSLGRSYWGIYNSGGTVNMTTINKNDLDSNGIFVKTFNWRKGASSNTKLFVYSMPSSNTAENTIANIQLERGNKATPWLEAPEDIAERINSKADQKTVNELDNKISELETVAVSKEELGEIMTSMNNYKDALDANDIDLDKAKKDIVTLLDRATGLETDFGTLVERWNFIDTYMVAGNEGLFIGKNNGSTGIRISTDRIDFLNGTGKPVAHITNKLMKIDSGIFVKSAQIGEHKVETMSNGHTIWQWMK